MTAALVHRALAAMAGILALGAAAAGSPHAGGEAGLIRLTRAAERGEGSLDAVQLGEWIKDRKPGLRVIDLRDEALFTDFHLPGAERLDSGGLASLVPVPGETVVLYGDVDMSAAAAWAVLRSREAQGVRHLSGGVLAWLSEAMEPMLPVDPTAGERADFDRAAAISRYFGGMPRRGVPRAEWVVLSERAFGDGLADVLKRMRRRGCAF